MRIKQIGEFGLIDRIAKKIKKSKDVVIGIGDDCAVLRWKKDKFLLATCDMTIEGVHFTLKGASFSQIGHKALGRVLSDIAAMAGEPRWAVVSIGIPDALSVEDIDQIYAEMRALGARFKVDIVGGDTDSCDKLIIDVTAMGEVEPKRLATRGGAKPGDVIFVTGTLGGSAKRKHLEFTPRVKEARMLSKNFKITSMIDISDGLSSDLWQIARSSGVGAKIYKEKIPVSKDSKGFQGALNDGEDFELLFTVPKDQAKRLSKFKLGLKVTQIGEIVAKSQGLSIADKIGRSKKLSPKGYVHF